MPETVGINEESKIIEVLSFGDVAFEHIAESIKKVTELHKQTGINKVLIDTGEMISLPPVSDMFNLASMFPRDLRIAVLISKKVNLHKDLHFGKTVALNRGVLISIFESKEKALKWLHRL